MTRPTDDRIARLIHLDPSETGSGFDAPTADLREEWHDYQGRDPQRMDEDVDALIWFGKWAWRLVVVVAVVALALAFWNAWGAQ